jgi:hypothetical protein
MKLAHLGGGSSSPLANVRVRRLVSRRIGLVTARMGKRARDGLVSPRLLCPCSLQRLQHRRHPLLIIAVVLHALDARILQPGAPALWAGIRHARHGTGGLHEGVDSARVPSLGTVGLQRCGAFEEFLGLGPLRGFRQFELGVQA